MKTVIRDKNSKYHIQIQNFLNTKKDNKNCYNYIEVKKFLREVYNGVCCYCETKFEHGANSNIEHYYPKKFLSKNKKLIYSDFEHILCNLHYVCPDCNSIKSDKSVNGNICYKKNSAGIIVKKHEKSYIYSPNFLLISSRFRLPEYKVEDKFIYNCFEIDYIKRNDKKAKGTIDILDLNGIEKRYYLREDRIRVFNSALKISEELYTILYNEGDYCKSVLKYLFNELSNMMNDSSPYSTMIKNQFGEIYIKLYNKYTSK